MSHLCAYGRSDLEFPEHRQDDTRARRASLLAVGGGCPARPSSCWCWRRLCLRGAVQEGPEGESTGPGSGCPLGEACQGRQSREGDQALNTARSGQRKRHGHREKLQTWFIPFRPVVLLASG